MTNVSGTPEKLNLRSRLFECGLQALENDGWTISRVPKSGKSSVRRIKRGNEDYLVSIRTTQNTDIAFPRKEDDSGWGTLDDVDKVVASTVDDKDNPKLIRVHMMDGDEMRDRFDRAYQARLRAGHTIPLGRGVWLNLYMKDSDETVYHVGAGAGLGAKPIGEFPIEKENRVERDQRLVGQGLTIDEAKKGLAANLGVPIEAIQISIQV